MICSLISVSLQADVGPAAAARQAVPGDVLPRAALPGAEGDAAAADGPPGSPAAQRLPANAGPAGQRAAPAAVIAILTHRPRAKRAPLRGGFVHTAEETRPWRDQLIYFIVYESTCRELGMTARLPIAETVHISNDGRVGRGPRY